MFTQASSVFLHDCWVLLFLSVSVWRKEYISVEDNFLCIFFFSKQEDFA